MLLGLQNYLGTLRHLTHTPVESQEANTPALSVWSGLGRSCITWESVRKADAQAHPQLPSQKLTLRRSGRFVGP